MTTTKELEKSATRKTTCTRDGNVNASGFSGTFLPLPTPLPPVHLPLSDKVVRLAHPVTFVNSRNYTWRFVLFFASEVKETLLSVCRVRWIRSESKGSVVPWMFNVTSWMKLRLNDVIISAVISIVPVFTYLDRICWHALSTSVNLITKMLLISCNNQQYNSELKSQRYTLSLGVYTICQRMCTVGSLWGHNNGIACFLITLSHDT